MEEKLNPALASPQDYPLKQRFAMIMNKHPNAMDEGLPSPKYPMSSAAVRQLRTDDDDSDEEEEEGMSDRKWLEHVSTPRQIGSHNG